MKKTDLKELIRQNIIQELSKNPSEYNFLSEKKATDEEPKKEEEDDIEITADEETEEPEVDMGDTEDSTLSDADQEYLNTLETLKNKAKEMGDEKLENQIDNTITYFTRQHVVKEGIHDKDITSAPHTNIKTPPKGVGDYDPKERATNLAKLANMGPKKMNELDMESLNRMDELVNQNNLRMLVTAAQGIIKDLEEFEDDDIFDFIVSKIKELDMPDPSPIRENYEMRRLQRIAGLI